MVNLQSTVAIARPMHKEGGAWIESDTDTQVHYGVVGDECVGGLGGGDGPWFADYHDLAKSFII